MYVSHFICQAIKTILASLAIVVGILGALVRPRHEVGKQRDGSHSLIRMSASTARVLCPTCYGENDEPFRFCQWCGKSVLNRQTRTSIPLKLNEAAISKWYLQFTTACAAKASAKSRSATWVLFNKFLASRANGAVTMEHAQPKDVVEFLCWLDSSGTRRRTVVHARHCAAVGTKDLTACSTEEGECSLRYAFDSLRTNHVSKLSMVFEKELGVVTPWSNTLRVGNPVRSELVAQYMSFTTSEQKQAGVVVKQAPVILKSHLERIMLPMQIKLLQNASEDVERPTYRQGI